MTICCVPNCAYLSETSRMLAVYNELIAMGEDVTMATHGGAHEFVLKDEGVPYERLEPVMSAERCEEFVRAGPGIGPTGQSMYHLDELREHVKSEVEFFRARGVKAVLTGFALSTILSCRVVNIPHLASHAGSWVPPIIERGWQPLPFEYPFPLTVLRLMPSRLAHKALNWVCGRASFHCRAFNRVAKDLGVEPLHSFGDLLMGDVTLVTDVPEILGIPQEELESWKPRLPNKYRSNPRLRYVGPMYARTFGEVPDDVSRFLATDRPKVYVAFTSTTLGCLKAAYHQLSQMDLVAVMCTTNHSNAGLGDAPNILLRPFLPSHKVLPLVDVAVTTAGQGSVQAAMGSGTPLVAVPIQAEQDFNASLVSRHGAAVAIGQKDLARPTFAKALERVINDPSFKQAALTLQQHLSRMNGPLNAANILREVSRGA